MKFVWSYIKYKANRIMRNIEMVCRILFFCWKCIVVRILTKKYPHFKKLRTRRRWENMYFYKIELETRQIFQRIYYGFPTIRSIQIGNHGRVITISTSHGSMPETVFSKN